jgi:putative endonuclease
MKASHRQSLGRLGEALAAEFLEQRGYYILKRNIRTPFGEIDLLGQIDGALVFVEVKTRSSKALGPPEISVTAKKQEHMRSAAEYYMQQHPELDCDYRIDVICIQKSYGDGQAIIDHFENVIS